MYARRLQSSGTKVVVCDKPDAFATLQTELADTGIQVLRDGHAVSRVADLVIYSVEAAAITAVVREYGPSTKIGATVAGQTSVKAPEKAAFEKYLPDDVDIVSIHSLHGPSVTTEGQPLVSRESAMVWRADYGSGCYLSVPGSSRPSTGPGHVTTCLRLRVLTARSLSTTAAPRRRSRWSRTCSAALRVATFICRTRSTMRSLPTPRRSPTPHS